jgi:putative heme iron utilization protein
MTDATSRRVTEQVKTACIQFIRCQRVLMLATIDDDGQPCASHAPFTCDENGQPLIFISNLSAHTRNLRQQPNASIMIIDHVALAAVSTDQLSDIDSQAAFAPCRLQLNCVAQFITREHQDYAGLVARLRARQGSTMDMLASLPDFNLVRLTLQRGTFIQGFAQAYILDQDMLIGLFKDADVKAD